MNGQQATTQGDVRFSDMSLQMALDEIGKRLSVRSACRVLRDYQAQTVRLILALPDSPGKSWARKSVLTPEAVAGEHQATTPDVAVRRALGDYGSRHPDTAAAARWALYSREVLLLAEWHENPEWLRRTCDGSEGEAQSVRSYLSAVRAARVRASEDLTRAAKRAALGQEYGERVP